MTDRQDLAISLDLPMPASAPVRSIDSALASSARVFMGVFGPTMGSVSAVDLRANIEAAEGFLASCSRHAADLRNEMSTLTADEIERDMIAFVSAWPNASRDDLAGYGANLVQDVIEQRPCRYALRAGLRHLRQTSRFLPAIAEVVKAIGDAQARARNTVQHVKDLPRYIDRAKVLLANEESIERRRGAAADEAAAAMQRAIQGAVAVTNPHKPNPTESAA